MMKEITSSKTVIIVAVIKIVFALAFGILAFVAAFKLWGWWGVAFLCGLRGNDWAMNEARKRTFENEAKANKILDDLGKLSKRIKPIETLIAKETETQ